MRRLALSLAAAAFAASYAPAAHAVYTCTPATPTDTQVGVCAGVVCIDLCGPIVVVDPYCHQDSEPRIGACDAIDRLYYRSR